MTISLEIKEVGVLGPFKAFKSHRLRIPVYATNKVKIPLPTILIQTKNKSSTKQEDMTHTGVVLITHEHVGYSPLFMGD